MIFQSYIPVLLFAVIALFLSFAIVVLPLIVSRITGTYNPYKTKLSPYECGFDSAQEIPKRFNIRFYIVAIIFVVFDLEVALLFPWSIIVKQAGPTAFWSVMVFLFVLTVGFLYEWRSGALKWQ